MTESLREIPLSEVQEHSSVGSCWIILEGKVYDVSTFLSEHPGGFQVITELAGKDATASFEDVGHSKDAREMAKDYLIGTLKQDGSTPAAKPTAATTECKARSCCATLKEIILSPTWSNFLIPTTIGIIVYVLYKGLFKSVA
ncbi:hypothetical protein Q1695_010274 [Nippostrongylus brasiliensis]|nr:hypothetical protein Q1695_010274 [Nippostrongylus brasiliensis]